jgi:hypothetical protein
MTESITRRIDYEERDGVGIWILDDLAAVLESGELEAGEEHFRDVAGQPSMTGTVVVLQNSESLGEETLRHVNEKWSELGEATGIERTAYVSDGLARLAVSGQNEAEGMDSRGFDSLEEGVDWASEV